MIHSLPRTVSVVLVLFLFVAGSARAQLTVVGSSPVDGELNVSTTAIVQIQFSAPIDTSARFDDDFYLAFEASPPIPEPALAGVSEDFTSFFAQVQLEPDTRYMFLLTGAKSLAGDILSRPYVVNFSTGASLPTGSISGTITEAGAGKSADGALVAIFPDDPDNGIFGQNDGALFGAAVANASGQFTINYVPDGFYQVASAGDVNNDGLIEPETGDTFGLYDFNGDGLLDPVEVSGGAAVTGINLTIKIPAPVSARSNLPRTNPIATSIHSDAALVFVGGSFGNGGLSPQWTYVYYSASSLTHTAVFALGDQFVQSAYQDFGTGTDMTEPLPAEFLDSDVVGATADENGGADFLATHRNVEVFGFGGNVTNPYGEGKRAGERPSQSRSLFRLTAPSAMGLSGRSAKTALVTPTPLWTISYGGEMDEFPYFDFLVVTIHAVTGEVDPALAFYTAARANLDVANAAVAGNFPGGFLVMVKSGQMGLHRSGTSGDWEYWYRSNANTVYRVRVQEGVVLEEGLSSLGMLRSTAAIPEGWVDSPQATTAAETESGGFRSTYPNAYVETVLAQGIDPEHPTLTIWEFGYYDGFSGASELILVNAGTGLVVGTDDEEELPSALRLEQNYPNPFNPETSINYEVPAAGGVRLLIFDLLGRQVRTLVDGELAAGRYTAVWDGADENGRAVSSGIYVYRVEAAGRSETRSMTLLR